MILTAKEVASVDHLFPDHVRVQLASCHHVHRDSIQSAPLYICPTSSALGLTCVYAQCLHTDHGGAVIELGIGCSCAMRIHVSPGS